MVAKPLCPLYKNIIKPLDRASYHELRYIMYGAKEQVTNVHLPQERHDYGVNKRQANYDFFIRVFGLDRSKLDESKVKVEKPEVLQSVIR